MIEQAELNWDGNKTVLPLITGTAGERAIDISKLRDQTGLITLGSGYGNTGACKSSITFIDGEKGILRYRGIPIEELAEQSTFLETAYLIIYEKLPTHEELRQFSDLLARHELMHENMKFHFEGFPPNAHPMAILSSMIPRQIYIGNPLASYVPIDQRPA
jgi:citrate synthase